MGEALCWFFTDLNQDMSVSDALQLARQVDPQGVRQGNWSDPHFSFDDRHRATGPFQNQGFVRPHCCCRCWAFLMFHISSDLWPLYLGAWLRHLASRCKKLAKTFSWNHDVYHQVRKFHQRGEIPKIAGKGSSLFWSFFLKWGLVHDWNIYTYIHIYIYIYIGIFYNG